MSASINISELAAELLAAPTNPRLRLVAASHGPWLLAAADALRGSADQRAAAARLVALLLPLHHQLQPVLLELCRASPLLLGAHAALPAEQLLPQLAAASAAAGGVGVPPSPRLLRCAELLPLLMHPSPAARDAVARLLARLLGVADLPRQQLLAGWAQEAAAAPAAALRFLPLPPAPAAAPRLRPPAEADALPARVVCVGQELVYTSGAVSTAAVAPPPPPSSPPTAAASALVRTAHAEAALAALAVALGSGRPTLLSGPPGCGKTALLAELARRVGQDGTGGGGGNGGGGGVVVVHLDDLSDSKTLLGSYVCAEAPGEFVWQPGVVTQAVTQGRWLLLEDVDVAPAEVMAALAPLLARNELYVPGRAQTLRAAPGFHLWATLTLQDGKRASAVGAAAAWQHVAVPPMAEADLVEIVATRCPALRAAAPQFVRRFSSSPPRRARAAWRAAAAAARAAARAASAARRRVSSRCRSLSAPGVR